MKIIKAKQSGVDRVAYINANRIDSFYATTHEGRNETKIYFGERKCEIEGDETERIALFMQSDDDCGFLDLTMPEVRKRAKHEITLEDITKHGVLTGMDTTSVFMKGDNNNGSAK